jgi:hypothetical protein
MDAEAFEAGLDAAPDLARGPTAEHVGAVCPRGGGLSPDVCRNSSREIVDVVAAIAVFGYGLATPQRRHRSTELVDLAAGVVEVVLARHLLPARLEDSTEQVTDEGAAGVTDRERAGRVSRNELHVDAARRDRFDATPGSGVGQDPIDHRLEGTGLDPDIEEARRRDLGSLDRGRVLRRRRIAHEFRGEQRGKLERRASIGPRELHRQIRREIAMGPVGRTLYLDRRPCIHLDRGECAVIDRARPRALDGAAYLGAQGGWGHGGIVPAGAVGRRYWCGSWAVGQGVREDRSLRGVNEIPAAWSVVGGLVRSPVAGGTRPASTCM